VCITLLKNIKRCKLKKGVVNSMTLAADVAKKRKKKKGNLFEPLLGVSKPSTVNATKRIKGPSKSTIYTNLIPFTMIRPD